MKKKLFQAGIGIGLLLLISPTANAQWVRTNGPGGQAVTALAASGQNIYAGTNKGVYFSSDKGENWTEVNSDAGSSVSAQITALAVYDSDVFAATAGGIFLSTNTGTGWAMVNTGLPYNFQITCFAESDSNVFIGTNRVTISGSVPASGVFISTQPHHDTVWSYDTVWFNDTGTIYDTIWSFNPFDSSIMIIDSIIKIENSVIKRVDSIEKTVKSINSSMKWNKVNTGLVDTNVNCIAVGGSTVFAGTSSGVFRTTNNGTNWTAFNSGLANTTVTSLSVNGNFVFAGTSGDLFITTIDGTNWIAANSVINDSGGIISSLAVIGDNIFAGTNHGYSTTTHGMIGTSGSIFLSANNGSDWKKVDTGLGGLGIYALAICDNTVFIGNYGYGVWRRPLFEMTGEMAGTQRHTPSPPLTDFHLSVFSRSIQKIAIDFHLVKSDMVIAKVYNISGREMVKLIDGNLGTGMQRISWDTKNVAAGYYTLRMRVGSIFYVKSILVSR